jgi:hypothetical protein
MCGHAGGESRTVRLGGAPAYDLCLYRCVVPAIAGPARLVPLAALATPGISSAALRAAAVRGALQATKGPDGQWRSSRNWVDEYASTREKRMGRPRILGGRP